MLRDSMFRLSLHRRGSNPALSFERLVTGMMQKGNYYRREQAINTEPMPATLLEPFAQPLQGKQAGKKCADKTQQADTERGDQSRARAEVFRPDQAHRFAGHDWRGEDHRQCKAKVLGLGFF